MEPDQTLNEVEATKQVESIEPAASEGTATAEVNADAAAPAAADNLDAPVEAGAPPQIDPIATEAVAVQEPQQSSEQE
jgi:hypothetical protein